VTSLHSRRAFLALAASGVAGVGTAAATQSSESSTTTTNGTSATTTTNRTSTANGTRTGDGTRTPAPEPTGPIGDHPMFGRDPARTGAAPDERGPDGPVKSQWCVGSGGHRLTPLAVSDGTVFSGSPSDGLRALDATTGRTRWQARLDGHPSAPAVVGDQLYTTDDRAVYALGRESGRELWSTALGDRVTTSALVAADGERVFAASIDEGESGERAGAHVHALDAADGATRWNAPTEGGNVFGSLALRDRLVCGGGSGHYFYAFDADTGDRRWRADLGDHATSPAIGRGSVFVGDERGTVFVLDRSDGTQRWTYETGAKIRSSPAVSDGTVYVSVTDGYLYAFDATSGTRRWRFDGGRRLTTSPTVVGTGDDAVVYVGSEQGNVFAVDAATGTRRWSVQLSDAVETPPVVVDGYAFAGDREGRVHALIDESASTSDGAGTCAAPRTATPAPDGEGDDDGDGVSDRDDYAPRDPGVQRRADLDAPERDEPGFLPGIGVGTVGTLLGVGTGWWLRSRAEQD